MSSIILPEGYDDSKEEPKEGVETKPTGPEYQPTEADEERFFLMYHMNFQPSETENLSPTYRKWLIMRFVAQKHMEQEQIQRQKLMQQIGPNLKVTGA